MNNVLSWGYSVSKIAPYTLIHYYSLPTLAHYYGSLEGVNENGCRFCIVCPFCLIII